MFELGSRVAAERGISGVLSGAGPAHERAASLFAQLGVRVERRAGPRSCAPADAWALSGAMALTGWPEGPPLEAPGPIATAAQAAALAFAALCAPGALPLDGAALLGERAALFGFARGGRRSPGGACRLLRARDAWIALSLAREDDVAALPAWLELDAPMHRNTTRDEVWRIAERGVCERDAATLAARAQLLGLPAALAAPLSATPPAWLRACAIGAAVAPRPADASPWVVDLSGLWAGPLAASLLGAAGARVVKLESLTRPDGARAGNAAFFDLLNGGKRSAALDLRDAEGRRALHTLLARADIAIESARPRALRQLGVDAEAWLRARPGRTWVSITGYGRSEPAANRVAFGDDAAVAAGLAAATGGADAPLFCADAIADPLTGLHAALAAQASWRAGGGQLLDLALCDVAAASAVALCDAEREAEPAASEAAAAPRARAPRGRAASLGADTAALLAEARSVC
jgi:crotonobetainyl-CoA:carnitine CoA-transferase CaiB-like acyl-CoA transferase